MKRRQFTLRSLFASVALLGIGLAMTVEGARLEMQNPRSNSEDITAWRVLVVGTFLVGAGIATPFTRPVIAVLIGLATPPVVFILLELFILGCVLGFALWSGGFG